MNHTPLPWRAGDSDDSIVSDHMDPDDPTNRCREDHVAYYGGNLIAESCRPADRNFILHRIGHFDQLVNSLDRCISMLLVLKKDGILRHHNELMTMKEASDLLDEVRR